MMNLDSGTCTEQWYEFIVGGYFDATLCELNTYSE